MKYNYTQVLVLFLIATFLFSCNNATDSPASASFIIANPLPLHHDRTTKSDNPVAGIDNKIVWICRSAASKRYHYSNACRGLKRCTHSIFKTTVDSAKAVGLTVCVFEN